MRKLLWLLLVSAGFAQGVPWNDIALDRFGSPIPQASVRVCTSAATGSPCTPLANIFSDSALTQAIIQPGFTTDAFGNFSFWASAGIYNVQITAQGVSKSYFVNLASSLPGAYFDVRAYGKVVADGATDTLPAFQAAENAAIAAGGTQTIVLPRTGTGCYSFSKPPVIHNSNLIVDFGNSTICGTNQMLMAVGPLNSIYSAFPVVASSGGGCPGGPPYGGNLFPISSTGDSNGNPYWIEPDDGAAFAITSVQFTIDFWFCLTAAPADNSELYGSAGIKDDDSAAVIPLDAFFTSGALTARLTVSGTLKSVAIGTPSLNAWHHFAMTWDGTNIRGFLDGSLNGTTAAAGSISWPKRSAVIIGQGNPANWPDGGGQSASPSGYMAGIRFSNTARWTASFTVPTTKPVADGNIIQLCNFDNQYDIFSGCTQGGGGTVYLPVHRATGGSALLSNVAIKNLIGSGDGPWIYGSTNSHFDYITMQPNFRRGLTFWGGGTFQNHVLFPTFIGTWPFGVGTQWAVAGLAGANGLTTIDWPFAFTDAPFPYYFQAGSVTFTHAQTTPTQGTICDFYFDGTGTNNMTVNVGGNSGADNENPNTAYLADVCVTNVQAFEWDGGGLGAGNIAQPVARVKGGGAVKFNNVNFVLNAGAPSVVKVVSAPGQPILFDNPIQQGATNIPWADGSSSYIVWNNPTNNCTNGLLCFQKDGTWKGSSVNGSGGGIVVNNAPLITNASLTSPIISSSTFAGLGTTGNGTLIYCSDCTIANPCAGGGSGALAKRIGGVWVCN